MTVLLVVLTFVALVALDYAIQQRRARAAAEQRRLARQSPQPVRVAQEAVPHGVFLQPTFTWSRIGGWGEIYLGVHPMLLGLIGTPLEVEFRSQGAQVARGEPLVRLGYRGRRLTVPSPVSGRVDRVNRPALTAQAGWRGADSDAGPWLYRVLPDRITDEVNSWLTGDAALSWTRRRYAELRAYIMDAAAQSHVGVVMADGGELPVGILEEMDEPVWAGLDRQIARGATADDADLEATP